jgi:outer membrane autotransporter protein
VLAAVLWLAWASLGFAQTSATVTTLNGTGAGSITEAINTINADPLGGTITFQITGGGTINATGLTVSSPVSLVNANGSSGAVTVNLGGGPLLINTTTPVSFGANTAWSSSLVTVGSTSTLHIGDLAGAIQTNGSSSGVNLYGITSTGNCTIDNLTGSVTAQNSDSSNTFGIYSTGDITFTNAATGSVTASGSRCSAICSAGNINFSGGFSGSINSGTTASTNACGIQCDSSGSITVTGDLGGAIAVVGSNTSSWATAIICDRGGLNITGNLTSDIDASAKYASGITAKSIQIDKGFTGSITANGVNSAYGLNAGGGAVSIANGISGAISATATDSNAVGVLGSGGIYGSDVNSALKISGSVSASGAAAYAFGSGGTINAEVTSTGTVSAQSTGTGDAYAFITMSPGLNSTIQLDSGCTVVGDISLAGTADSMTLAASSDSVSHSTTLAGLIDGVETINVTGGAWTVGGNIAGCNTIDISGGSASLNGTCSGAVTVEHGGTLYGTGTLASLTNRGTVAPGNSVGVLSVSGNYTQASGSTLVIETATGGKYDCDILDVAGSATIQGGTVRVVTTGGYKTDTQYTFLTAGSLSGADTASIITDSAFLSAALGYDATDMWFTLTGAGRNYVDEAHTHNQYDVASYLDAHKSGATGDFETVLDALNLQSGDGARAAFDAMGGEIHSSLETITFETSDRLLRSIAGRMRTQSMTQDVDFAANRADGNSLVYVNRVTSSLDQLNQKMSGWTTWFDSYGVGASIAGNGNASGLGYSTGGLTVGMERYLDEDTLFGFGGGYASSNTTLDARSDWGSIDGGQFCAYLHRNIESHYFTGIAAYGYNQYDTKRHIDFGGIDRTANADYNGNNYSVYLEAGRNVHGRFVHLQPFAALEYIGLQQNGFTEENANSIDLDVNSSAANALRGLVGTRVLNYFETKSGRLITLDASASWRHEFLNDNRVIDASFTGQTGSAFAISGVNVDRDAAIIGTGLNYAMSDHFSVYANYDLLFSQDYTAHTGLGGFQYIW